MRVSHPDGTVSADPAVGGGAGAFNTVWNEMIAQYCLPVNGVDLGFTRNLNALAPAGQTAAALALLGQLVDAGAPFAAVDFAVLPQDNPRQQGAAAGWAVPFEADLFWHQYFTHVILSDRLTGTVVAGDNGSWEVFDEVISQMDAQTYARLVRWLADPNFAGGANPRWPMAAGLAARMPVATLVVERAGRNAAVGIPVCSSMELSPLGTT